MYTGRIIILIVAFLSSINFANAQAQPSSRPKHPAPSLPEKAFETFWQTFEDHYAFFTLRQIDWKQSYQIYRPRINATTSDDSLFSILCQMVVPFNDDHINIINPDEKEFTVTKPSRFLQEFPDSTSRAKFWNVVNQSLLNNGFSPLRGIGPTDEGEQLFYYTYSEDYGYLRSGRCFITDETEDKPKTDAKLAGKILDSVLLQFKHVKGVIVDIRNNEGGNDEFAYAVAARFANHKTLGHTKQTRSGGYEDFGRPEKWYIQPHGKNIITQPVLLLTNDQTCSAADVLSMILKALPNVTIIGENSTGIFSDMYYFELPNKWVASLSNQRYYDANKICYEGIGTPVDIEIKNTRQDLIDMSDPMIIAAMKYFRKK